MSLKTGLARSSLHPFNDTIKRAYQTSARRSSSALYKDHPHLRRSKRNLHRQREDDQSTDGFDWRTKGVVASIKNQEVCGSCYAFATVAVLESAYAIKTKSQNVINFSPQQIVDCSRSNGNGGCCGGNFEPTVKYVLEQDGKIGTEDSYPYAEKEQRCKTYGVDQIDLGNIDYHQIPKGDEKAMAEALANYGPMYLAINAGGAFSMFYEKGIIKTDDCSPDQLDHAVVLVGYGYDNELQMPYWVIKNSWGTGWGEDGYFRMARDSGNMCGVASEAWHVKLE